MGLRVVRCRSVIILVISKLDSRFAVVQFRNHSYDYGPNRTPFSPITINNNHNNDDDDNNNNNNNKKKKKKKQKNDNNENSITIFHHPLFKNPTPKFENSCTFQNLITRVLFSSPLPPPQVMAGTGNLDVLRIARQLHKRHSPDVHYGNHMAVHMAIGLLFLGGGR